MRYWLNEEELIELTGYRMPSKQIQWCRDHGLRVYVRRDGHPKVLISDLQAPPVRPRTKPNFDVLRKIKK